MDTCTLCQVRDLLRSKGHRTSSSCPYFEVYCTVYSDQKIVTNNYSIEKCPRKKIGTIKLKIIKNL